MNSIIDKITQAICDFLISLIEGSLSTMFNDVKRESRHDCGGRRTDAAGLERKHIFFDTEYFSDGYSADCGAYYSLCLML